jgi:hypothetical protein
VIRSASRPLPTWVQSREVVADPSTRITPWLWFPTIGVTGLRTTLPESTTRAVVESICSVSAMATASESSRSQADVPKLSPVAMEPGRPTRIKTDETGWSNVSTSGWPSPSVPPWPWMLRLSSTDPPSKFRAS